MFAAWTAIRGEGPCADRRCRQGVQHGGLRGLRRALHRVRMAAHVPLNCSDQSSSIGDEVTVRTAYQASQVHRKRIEQIFAWVKTGANLAKPRHCGLARVDWQFSMARAACNLIRVPNLSAVASWWHHECQHRGSTERQAEGLGRRLLGKDKAWPTETLSPVSPKLPIRRKPTCPIASRPKRPPTPDSEDFFTTC